MYFCLLKFKSVFLNSTDGKKGFPCTHTGECVGGFFGVRCLTWPCWAELTALCFSGKVSVVQGGNTVRGKDLKYHNFAL